MTNKTAVNEAMLEKVVNAAGEGHDLEGFEVVSDADGYQTRCRRCACTAWVSFDGLMYNLLGNVCSGRW